MIKGDPGSFDVIVVGSGIGGLTAAGMLAAAGQSVLVVEHHDRPGGYAHGFRRRRYNFDAAVHLISGCGPQGFPGGQVIHHTLKALGVCDQIEFLPVDPFANVVFSGTATALPQTIDGFARTLGKRFPSESAGLRKLLSLCSQLCRETIQADALLAEAGAGDLQQRIPALMRYRKSTVAEVCAEFIRDRQLFAILTGNWPYLGLPPSMLSFVYWSNMLIGYLEDGACYCRGGFQKLADTLVFGLQKNGAQVRYRSTVERIRVNNNRIAGVELKNGEVLRSSTVIANSDMRHTIFDLMGREHFPQRYLARIERLKISLSIFAVYLATDLDLENLGWGHESFCYPHDDHDLHYQNSCRGEINWIGISVPSLTDDSLAPQGTHLVILTTLVPYRIDQPWKQVKTETMNRMVDLAELHLPGLKDRLLYAEGASPQTMQRYTRNSQGSAYGWELSPGQVGPNRVGNACPIEGLFFAGHWATPGGGVYGAAVSGMQTAKQVLGLTGQHEI